MKQRTILRVSIVVLAAVIVVGAAVYLILNKINADQILADPRMVYQTGYGSRIRLIPAETLGNSGKNLFIAQRNTNGVWKSSIYEIVNGSVLLRKTFSGKLEDIVYNDAQLTSDRWVGFFTAGNRLGYLKSSTGLTSGWHDNQTLTDLVCPKKKCQFWGADGNNLLSSDPMRPGIFTKNFIAAPMIIANMSRVISHPGTELAMCSVSNMVFTKAAAWWGGECPLDDAFLKKAVINRDSFGNITSIGQKTEITDPKRDWSNRMVRQVFAAEDYIIASGEGWIGRTSQTNQTNWTYPVWQDEQTNSGSYIYANNITKAGSSIIVSGFDKSKHGEKNGIVFKLSTDRGNTFKSIEPQLFSYIKLQLLKSENLSEIVNIRYSQPDQKVYFTCVIVDTLDTSRNRYVLESVNLSAILGM